MLFVIEKGLGGWSEGLSTYDVNPYAYSFNYDSDSQVHIGYMTEDFPGVFHYTTNETDIVFDSGYWLPSSSGEGSMRTITTNNGLVYMLYHCNGALCVTSFMQGYVGLK